MNTPLLLVVAALTACTSAPPAGESGAPAPGDDTADDTADDTGAVDLPEWFDQPWVAAHTFSAGAGMAWEIDEDFAIDRHTVPALLVATDGTYRMFVTEMGNHGRVSMLRSDDGVSWSDDAEQILAPDDYDGGCGERLIDSAVVYLDDGSYRLVVEALVDDEGFGRVFCSASSTDGDVWQAEEGIVWQGSDNDFGTISVPEIIRMPDGRWFLYYIGDFAGEAGPELGDGVRVAASSDGGRTFESVVDTNMLPVHDTDPFPVFLDDGRFRLYHTHRSTGGGWARRRATTARPTPRASTSTGWTRTNRTPRCGWTRWRSACPTVGS